MELNLTHWAFKTSCLSNIFHIILITLTRIAAGRKKLSEVFSLCIRISNRNFKIGDKHSLSCVYCLFQDVTELCGGETKSSGFSQRLPVSTETRLLITILKLITHAHLSECISAHVNEQSHTEISAPTSGQLPWLDGSFY